jgi:peptide chain release factor 1
MAENILLNKLKEVKVHFEDIQKELTDPDTISNMDLYVKLNKEYKDLEDLMILYKAYDETLSNLEYTLKVLDEESEEEMREMAKMELEELKEKREELEEKIRVMLLPKDPEDDKNAIMEIRAGTGGDEAGIFAGDLFRLYSKYCEKKGWKMNVTNTQEAASGGFKEIVLEVTGNDVYGILKYESGVHRVQRVPETETQGRVHTSAATVAVLPEAEDFEIDLKPEDIRKDTFCASGPGGQSVNTTYSAIRLTHAPTGIVVTCQDEKSQLKNLDKAMKELKTRLYNLEYQKYLDDISSKRKTMVSSGDRSAKIRTYNYPQGRVTDHRINYTAYNLQAVMDGDIDEIIEKLQIEENAEKLKHSGLDN